MASINRAKRELVFKIVFYGPGLGGKTTSLRHVHGATRPDHRGNLVSLATETDRTLYFDYLPLKLLRLGEMGIKLQLYTVPGQVYYAATRKLVLNGADGVVFVADTQAARFESNHESLEDLTANLAEQGRKLSSVPHVFQWNKRDLPDVVSIEEADRRLNLFGAPAIPTIATTGEGVFQSLERITRLVVEAYRAELPGGAPGLRGGVPASSTGVRVPLFLDAEEIGLAEAIKGLTDAKAVSAEPASSGEVPAAALERSAAATASDASESDARLGDRKPAEAENEAPQASPITPEAKGAPENGAPSPPSSSPRPTPPAPPAGPNGLAPTRAPPSAGGTSQRARGATRASQVDAAPPFSLSELWPADDREAVRRGEQAIAEGNPAGCIEACQELLARTVGAAWDLIGGRSHADARDPATLLMLLGADGPSYLSFLAIVHRTRMHRTPTRREALECYAFAVEARRRLDRFATHID